MPLDEKIYGIFSNYLRKRKLSRKDLVERTVTLEVLKPRLTLIARAITGEAIDIYPAEREGGYKNINFFLPQTFSLFPTKKDNEDFYLFRILFLSTQKNKGFNYSIGTERITLEEAQTKALEYAPQVLQIVKNDFNWAKGKHDYFYNLLQSTQEIFDTSWLYGKWMVDMPIVENKKQLKNFTDKVKLAQKKEIIETILKAKPVEELKSLTVDRKQQEDHVLNNYFEKIETAEEFGGGTWRDFDGSDELNEHQDALNEMQMKNTVRVDDPVHSVYQADFIENTTIAESAETDSTGYHVKYDEWNHSKASYKTDYCKVYPKTQLKTNPEYYKKTLRDNASTLLGLRKMLTTVNNRYRIQRRQNQGDEFDLDALTDLYVDIKTGHNPSENIYLSKRKKDKDLSILFLLDISLSSDSYAAGNRVIDVEKQVSILFGEILNEFNVDFSINCFYSKTRNHTSFLTLKDFDENWDTAKYKIGLPQPMGYTRIGPALRHSGALLDLRDSENKWVILLSDGKPNDYDKYEGKYGINDIKQALRELNQRNINTYAVAIEAEAKYYLPQMFGADHYEILTTPVELLQSLAKLYDKIKHK